MSAGLFSYCIHLLVFLSVGMWPVEDIKQLTERPLWARPKLLLKYLTGEEGS